MKIYKQAVAVIIPLLFTQSIHAFSRGQEAYVCIKVLATQYLHQLEFGCGYESYRVRILGDIGNNIHICFKESGIMGRSSGDDKWVQHGRVFFIRGEHKEARLVNHRCIWVYRGVQTETFGSPILLG